MNKQDRKHLEKGLFNELMSSRYGAQSSNLSRKQRRELSRFESKMYAKRYAEKIEQELVEAMKPENQEEIVVEETQNNG